ncbi:pyridoxal phosphate-dependent aminotransferase [Salibacteraceae bacterium]|jgi:aspartate aminotransferase|nr:pyridoxal phosphate-dependent aminotransferase [Flavobacteriales bacterium]MDB9701335.1 pyridoxal phosphate-dependent aminotransferase [Salibacteraceae bacterium]
MTTLSDRIENLAESATIAMSQRSRDLKNKGVDVINLSLGEPDFNTPDFIKEAAKKAIDENYTHYTPVPGYLEVREAIAQKLRRDNGLSYKPTQIVISTGAKQSLMNTVLCLVNPGEEVIIPAPFWVSYNEMAGYAEGKVVQIKTGFETNFKITPEQLESAITANTKLFIFSSPSNPTGGAYSEAELRALGKVFERHPKVHVVSDEIYEHIRFVGTHFSLASIPEIHDRVITVNGVSKAWAMTGWRIGYIAASEKIAKACTKIQGQFTSAPSGISQMAAKAAMEADRATVNYMIEAFKERRLIMIEGMRSIPGLECNEPEGAFYLFPKVSSCFGKSIGDRKIENAEDLAMYLLEVAHVATVPGSAFGADDYLRLSYAAANPVLVEAISRIKTAIEQLEA